MVVGVDRQGGGTEGGGESEREQQVVMGVDKEAAVGVDRKQWGAGTGGGGRRWEVVVGVDSRWEEAWAQSNSGRGPGGDGGRGQGGGDGGVSGRGQGGGGRGRVGGRGQEVAVGVAKEVVMGKDRRRCQRQCKDKPASSW